MSDYYSILGVSKDTPQDALKAAYIKRLKQYHPDIYKGADATEKTQKINEAYQTLKDPQKRAAYDFDRRFATDDSSAYSAGGGASAAGTAGGGAGTAGGGFTSSVDSEVVAYAAGGFAARRQALQQQIDRILSDLRDHIIRQRSLGINSRLIRDDLERDFLSARDKLQLENAQYYQQLLHPLLQPATMALVGQLQASQQNFISRNMDAALPQLIAAAGSRGKGGGSFGRAGRFDSGNSIAFWWGFGLSLFFSWLPLLCVGLMLGFGRKTPGRWRFLFGCLLGAAISTLYLAR